MRASILFAISIGLGALLALLSSVTPIPQTADSAPSENGCSLPGVATWGMAFMTPRGDDGVSVPETEPVVRVQCFHHRDEPGTSRLGVVGANLRRAAVLGYVAGARAPRQAPMAPFEIVPVAFIVTSVATWTTDYESRSIDHNQPRV